MLRGEVRGSVCVCVCFIWAEQAIIEANCTETLKWKNCKIVTEIEIRLLWTTGCRAKQRRTWSGEREKFHPMFQILKHWNNLKHYKLCLKNGRKQLLYGKYSEMCKIPTNHMPLSVINYSTVTLWTFSVTHACQILYNSHIHPRQLTSDY